MIAVTGANGLLGSFVVRQLVAAGMPFIALKRAGSDTSLLHDIEASITWRDADLLDPIALHDALEGVSTIIHTAALVSFNPRDAEKLFEINVTGTGNLVNTCLVRQVKRFVHVSSVAALSRPKDVSVVSEDQKWTDSPHNTTYAESKHMAELEVMRGQEEGLNTVIVNPAFILAPANWHRSSAMIFKYVYQQKPFYANGSLNYVDVRDVATIIVKLMNTPIQGERFTASAGHITYKSLFDEIAKNFNRKPPHIRLRNKVVSLLAWLEGLRANLTGATPLITRETARGVNVTTVYNNEKVKNTLNFEFQSIEDTLQWCCKHYLHQVNSKK